MICGPVIPPYGARQLDQPDRVRGDEGVISDSDGRVIFNAWQQGPACTYDWWLAASLTYSPPRCRTAACGRASAHFSGSPSGPFPRWPVPSTVEIVPDRRSTRRIAWFSVSTMYNY